MIPTAWLLHRVRSFAWLAVALPLCVPATGQTVSTQPEAALPRNPSREAYMRARLYVNPRDLGASGEGQVWTRGRIEAGARQVVVKSAASFHPGQGVHFYAEDGSKLSTLITAIEGRTLEFRDSWPGLSGPVSVYHDDTWAVLNALLRFGTHGQGRLDNLDSRGLSMCFPPGQYNLSRTVNLASHQAWVGGDGINDSATPAVLAALPGFAPDPPQERFMPYEYFDHLVTGTNSFWLYLRNLRLVGLRPETNPGLSCLHYMGSHRSVVEKVSSAGFRRPGAGGSALCSPHQALRATAVRGLEPQVGSPLRPEVLGP